MPAINHVSQYMNVDYEEGDQLLVDLDMFSTERFATYIRSHGEEMAVVKIMGDTVKERVVPLTSIEPNTVVNPPQAKKSAIQRKSQKEGKESKK